MKREIKFRAWDTPNKYMITHKELCLVPLTYDEVFKGKEGYPLMQYTGLKDKNGVEIYEGDIVYIAGKGNCEVKFQHLCWEAIIIKPKFNLDDVFPISESYFEGDVETVLGNIYENPELLEDS